MLNKYIMFERNLVVNIVSSKKITTTTNNNNNIVILIFLSLIKNY